MSEISVTCAIIVDFGRVLAAKRKLGSHMGGRWEFPGGKQQDGETLNDCLVREIREELGLEVEVLAALESAVHVYPEKTIRLHPFVCRVAGGELRPVEHEEVGWFGPDGLAALDWAPADVPVLRQWVRFSLLNGEVQSHV